MRITQLAYGASAVSGVNIFLGVVLSETGFLIGTAIAQLVVLAVLGVAAVSYNRRVGIDSYAYLHLPFSLALLTAVVGLFLAGLKLNIFS